MRASPCYELSTRVRFAYCDMYNRMTVSYMLKEAQQVSMEHCQVLGIGHETLRREGQVFILARLKVDICRAPVGGETIRIVTQPHAPVRCVYPRFTRFYGADGTQLAQIDSRWVLVNLGTLRLLTSVPETMRELFAPYDGVLSPIRPAQAEGWREAASREVTYAVTDVNRHMNNAAYADWAYDCLSEDLASGRAVKAFSILYHHEARLGERIRLKQAETGASFRMDGYRGDTLCFESEAWLSPCQ